MLPAPIPLTVKGHTINFFFFCNVNGNPREKVQTLKEYFSRMPSEHLAVVAGTLILVVERLSGGRCTGGGYYPSVADWIGREQRTGVSDVFFAFRSSGVLGITRRAFNNNGVRPFTVIHECAHAVHQRFAIYPQGARLRDYRGIRYSRSNHVEEYAAETYARYVVKPNQIYRPENKPANESRRACNARLRAQLFASPAGRHFQAEINNQEQLPSVDQKNPVHTVRTFGGLPIISSW